MNYVEKKQRMDYLLELIEKGRCLSLSQIADKFECSERTVKRMIAQLRNQGYDIRYCHYSKKFYRADLG